MRTMGLLCLLVAVLGLSAAAHASSPGAASAPAAAATPAELAPILRAIREANTVNDAVAAFNSAGDAGRRNIELNTAQLRRLLQLGHPETAGLPAATLIALDANSGMAFGVVGFNSGRQNRLSEALVSSIKAAYLAKDDPSILNNLGQMVAWCDGAKTFKLPAEDQTLLDKVKAESASKAPYATAYKTIKDAYDKQAADTAANLQAVTAADKDVKDAEKKGADAQQTEKAVEDEAAAHHKRSDDLQKQLSKAGLTAAERNRLQTDQKREQVAEADVNSKKLPPAKKAVQDAVNVVTQKRQALDTAKKKTSDTVPLAKLLHWLPPAVDGVVTPPFDSVAAPASKPASPPASLPASAPASAG
jgi:hypothetical protein